MPVTLATQEAEIRMITVQSQPTEIVHETPSQKHLVHKRVGAVTQVVACLPSKQAPVLQTKKLKIIKTTVEEK
jgi:hypothetical protein